MKQLYCATVTCGTALLSSDEQKRGLCDSCINLLQKRHSYAVVCNQCGDPTFIDMKPTEKSRPIIKDKYIMSESCFNCDPSSDGHRYLNTKDGLSQVVLGEGQTLNPSKHGLLTGLPVKSPIHRTTGETVLSSGSDIISKIQLSNQRAEEFLDNLTWKDD